MATQDPRNPPLVRGFSRPGRIVRTSGPSRGENPFGGVGKSIPKELQEKLPFAVPNHMTTEQMFSLQAKMQPQGEKLRNSMVQFAGTLTGQFLESVGGILSITEIAKGIYEGEYAFDNYLARLGKELQDETRERFPIYESDPGSFNPFSLEWWFTNAPQLASTVAMMLPGVGAAKIVGGFGKALGMGRNLTKSQQALLLAGGSAGFQRAGEAYMEGLSTWDDIYKKKLQEINPETGKAYTPEEANLIASSSALEVYKHNLALVTVDFVQNAMLFGSMKNLSGLRSKMGVPGFNKWYYQVPGQMTIEAGEEGVQYLFQKEAEFKADGGDMWDSGFASRLVDYVHDAEFWTSMTLGALGGGIFSGIGYLAADNIFNAESKANRDIEARRRQEELNAMSSDPEVLYKTMDKQMLFSAVKYMKRGELHMLQDAVDKASDVSQEQLDELGITRDVFEEVMGNHKDLLEKAGEVYNQAMDLNVSPFVIEEYFSYSLAGFMEQKRADRLEQNLEKITQESMSDLEADVIAKKINHFRLTNLKRFKGRNQKEKDLIQKRITELEKEEASKGPSHIMDKKINLLLRKIESSYIGVAQSNNIIQELGTKKGREQAVERGKKRLEKIKAAAKTGDKAAKNQVPPTTKPETQPSGKAPVPDSKKKQVDKIRDNVKNWQNLTPQQKYEHQRDNTSLWQSLQSYLKKEFIKESGREMIDVPGAEGSPGFKQPVPLYEMNVESTQTSVAPNAVMEKIVLQVGAGKSMDEAVASLTPEETKVWQTPEVQEAWSDLLEQAANLKSNHSSAGENAAGNETEAEVRANQESSDAEDQGTELGKDTPSNPSSVSRTEEEAEADKNVQINLALVWKSNMLAAEFLSGTQTLDDPAEAQAVVNEVLQTISDTIEQYLPQESDSAVLRRVRQIIADEESLKEVPYIKEGRHMEHLAAYLRRRKLAPQVQFPSLFELATHTSPISINRVNSLQADPGDVYLTEEQADNLMNHLEMKYGIQNVLDTITTGDELGWFDRVSQTIYIRTMPEGVSRNTIIHEYLHPFVDILKYNNAPLYRQLVREAREANKENPFFFPENYPIEKQDEEFAVRYLVQQHIGNLKKRNIFQQFWDWLTSFFHSLRSYSSADIEQLSPDTSVRKLDQIFRNYGTLSKDSAIATASMKARLGIDKIEELIAQTSDVETIAQLEKERQRLSLELLAKNLSTRRIVRELSKLGERLAELQAELAALKQGGETIVNAGAKSMADLGLNFDQFQQTMATPQAEGVRSTSSQVEKVLNNDGLTSTYTFTDELADGTPRAGKTYDNPALLGEQFNIPNFELFLTQVGDSVVLSEVKISPTKSPRPSTLTLFTAENAKITIELAPEVAESYAVSDTSLISAVRSWNALSPTARMDIANTVSDPSHPMLLLLLKAAEDGRISKQYEVGPGNQRVYRFMHSKLVDNADNFEITTPKEGQIFERNGQNLVFNGTIRIQGRLMYIFFDEASRDQSIEISPDAFQTQINSGEIIATDRKVTLSTSGVNTDSNYTSSSDSKVEDLSDDLQNDLIRLSTGQEKVDEVVYDYNRSPQAFGKGAIRTDDYVDDITIEGGQPVARRTNIPDSEMLAPYPEMYSPGELKPGTPLYLKPIEDPDQMITYKGEKMTWGAAQAREDFTDQDYIDYHPIGIYKTSDDKLVMYHHAIEWINEANIYETEGGLTLEQDRKLNRASRQFILDEWNSGRTVATQVSQKLFPLLLKGAAGWNSDVTLDQSMPEAQIDIFAKNTWSFGEYDLVNKPEKLSEGTAYAIIPTPIEGKYIALPLARKRVNATIASSLKEATRVFATQDKGSNLYKTLLDQGYDITTAEGLHKYFAIFVHLVYPDDYALDNHEGFKTALGAVAYNKPSDWFGVAVNELGVAFAAGAQNDSPGLEGEKDFFITQKTPRGEDAPHGHMLEYLLDRLEKHLLKMHVHVSRDTLGENLQSVVMFDPVDGVIQGPSYQDFVKLFLYTDVIRREFRDTEGELMHTHFAPPKLYFSTHYMHAGTDENVIYLNSQSGARNDNAPMISVDPKTARNKVDFSGDEPVAYFKHDGQWKIIKPGTNRYAELIYEANKRRKPGTAEVLHKIREGISKEQAQDLTPELSILKIGAKSRSYYVSGDREARVVDPHGVDFSDETIKKASQILKKDQKSLLTKGKLSGLSDFFDEMIMKGEYFFVNDIPTSSLEYDLFLDRVRRALEQAQKDYQELYMAEGVEPSTKALGQLRNKYKSLSDTLTRYVDKKYSTPQVSLTEIKLQSGRTYKFENGMWVHTTGKYVGKEVSKKILAKIQEELIKAEQDRREERKKTKPTKKTSGQDQERSPNDRFLEDMQRWKLGDTEELWNPTGASLLEEQFADEEAQERTVEEVIKQNIESRLLMPFFDIYHQQQLVASLGESIAHEFIESGDQRWTKGDKVEKALRNTYKQRFAERREALKGNIEEAKAKGFEYSSSDPEISRRYYNVAKDMQRHYDQLTYILSDSGWTFLIGQVKEYLVTRGVGISRKVEDASFAEDEEIANDVFKEYLQFSDLTRDPYDTINTRVKMLLAFIPKYKFIQDPNTGITQKKKKPMYLGISGLYDFEDGRQIYTRLLDMMQDVEPDYNEVLKVLYENKVDAQDATKTSDLWVGSLIDVLESGNVDQTTKNAFAVAITKTKIDMRYIEWNKKSSGYDVRIYHDDTSALAKSMRNEWIGNMRMNPFKTNLVRTNPTGEYFYTREGLEEILERISSLRDSLNAWEFENRNKKNKKTLWENKRPSHFYTDLDSLFRMLGIQLHDSVLYRILRGNSYGANPTGIKHSNRIWTFKNILSNQRGSLLFQWETMIKEALRKPAPDVSSRDILDKEKELAEAPEDQKESIQTQLEAMYADIPIESLDLHSEGMLSTLAFLNSVANRTPVHSSFYSGKSSISSFQERRFINDRTRELLSRTSGLTDRLMSVPYVKNSWWLSHMSKPDKPSSFLQNKYERFKQLFRISVTSLDALKKRRARYTKGKFKDMERNDMEIVKWSYYNADMRYDKTTKLDWTTYMFVVTGDKPVPFLFEAPRQVFPVSGHSVDSKSIDIIMDYVVLSEVNRIYQAQQNGKIGIEAYDRGSGLFYSIPELNNVEGIWTPTHKLKAGLLVDGKWADTSAVAALRRAVREHVEKDIQDQIDYWNSLDIMKGNETNFVSNAYRKRLQKTVGYTESDTQTVNIQTGEPVFLKANLQYTAAADYVLNHLLANHNFSQLYFGDPALAYTQHKFNAQKATQAMLADEQYDMQSEGYNYVLDVQATWDKVFRRTAADVAPGRSQVVIPGKESIRTAYAHDKLVDSVAIAFYEEYNLSPESYMQMTGTDAIVYITPEEYLVHLYSDGELNEDLYNEAMDSVKKNKSIPKHIRDKILFKPLKPVYVQNTIRNNVDVRNYIKMAMFPLLDNFQGLEIDKIRKAMEKDNVDMLVFGSAFKVGMPSDPAHVWMWELKDGTSEKPISGSAYERLTNEEKKLYKQSSVVNPRLSFKNHTIELPRKGLRIQQDVPFKEETEDGDVKVNPSTQARRNLFTDLGDKLLELNDQYHDIYLKHFYSEYEGLMNQLINPETGTLNVEEFQKLLLQEAVEREYTYNERLALYITKREDGSAYFKSPLWSTPARKRVESLIMSYVDKKVRKMLFKGQSLVIVSEEGFQQQTGAPLDKSDIVFTDAWNGSHLENGGVDAQGKTKPSQIFIRWPFGNTGLSLNDVIDPTTGRVDKNKLTFKDSKTGTTINLLEAYGFRIPNQGLMSSAPMEIAGFLPEDYALPIVATRDFLTQMGSDYDIDKLYLYLWDFVFINGQPQLFQTPQNEILKIHLEVLKDPASREKLFTPLDTKLLEKVAYGEMDEEGNILEEGLLSILEDEDQVYLSPYTPKYQLDKYYAAQQGKAGTGFFATASTMHSTMQMANHQMQKDPDIPADEDIHLSNFFFKMAGQESTGKLGLINSLDGSTLISKHLQELLSAAVDNEALSNLLGRLNVNSNTFGALKLLIYLGYDLKASLAFINQPIIKDYILEKSRLYGVTAQYQPSRQKKALENTLEKYGNADDATTAFLDNMTDDQKLEIGSKPLEVMIEDLKVTTPSPEFNARQIHILNEFEGLVDIASKLTKVEGALNTDSQGPGKSVMTAFKKFQIIQSLAKDNAEGNVPWVVNLKYVVGDFLVSDEPMTSMQIKTWKLAPFGTFREQKERGRYTTKYVYVRPTTVPGMTTAYTLSAVKELLLSERERPDNANVQTLFPYSSPELIDAFDRISYLSGRADFGLSQSVDFYEDLFDNLKAFLYSRRDMGIYETDIDTHRYELLIDNIVPPNLQNSLATILHHIRQDPKVATNTFLSSFNVVQNTNGDPSTISFNVIQTQDINKDTLLYDFVKMIVKPTTFQGAEGVSIHSHDLVNMLVQYAFLAHGGRQQAIEYIRYIPLDYLAARGMFTALNRIDWRNASNEVMGGYLYSRGSKMDMTSWERQYFQHFPWMLRDFSEILTAAERIKTGKENNDLSKVSEFFYNSDDAPQMVKTSTEVGKKTVTYVWEYDPYSKHYKRLDKLGNWGVFEYNAQQQPRTLYQNQRSPVAPTYQPHIKRDTKKYNVQQKRTTMASRDRVPVESVYPVDSGNLGLLESIALASQDNSFKELAAWYRAIFEKIGLNPKVSINNDLKRPESVQTYIFDDKASAEKARKKASGTLSPIVETDGKFVFTARAERMVPVKGVTRGQLTGGFEMVFNPRMHRNNALDYERTVLHEETHVLTKDLVRQYKEGNLDPEIAKHMETLDKIQRAFFTDIKLKNKLETSADLVKFYNELTSDTYYQLGALEPGKFTPALDEFIATLMTSPQLQEYLNSTIWEKGKSWWDVIWNIISDILEAVGITFGERLGDRAKEAALSAIRIAAEKNFYSHKTFDLHADTRLISGGNYNILEFKTPSRSRKNFALTVGKVPGLPGKRTNVLTYTDKGWIATADSSKKQFPQEISTVDAIIGKDLRKDIETLHEQLKEDIGIAAVDRINNFLVSRTEYFDLNNPIVNDVIVHFRDKIEALRAHKADSLKYRNRVTPLAQEGDQYMYTIKHDPTTELYRADREDTSRFKRVVRHQHLQQDRNSLQRESDWIEIQLNTERDPQKRKNLQAKQARIQQAIDDLEDIYRYSYQWKKVEDIKGVIKERMEQIYEQLEEDLSLQEVAVIMNSLDFIIQMGDTGAGAEHILFTEEEATSDAIMKDFAIWANEAKKKREELEKQLTELLAAEVSDMIGKPITAEELLSELRDTHQLHTHAVELSRHGDLLAQVIDKIYDDTNLDAQIEYQEVAQRYHKLHDSILPHLKRIQRQTGSNYLYDPLLEKGPDGLPSGKLLHPITNQYREDSIEKLPSSGKKRRAEQQKQMGWWRETHYVMDPRMLMPTTAEDEYQYTGKTFTQDEIDSYKEKLKNEIGEYFFNHKYRAMVSRVESFQSAYALKKRQLERNPKKLTPGQIQKELDNWALIRSPYIQAEYLSKEVKRHTHPGKNKTQVNYIPTYVVVVPRKTIKGKDTGWYNPEFDNIQNIPELFEFYQFYIEHMNVGLRSLPLHIRKKLSTTTSSPSMNFLPFYEENVGESLMYTGSSLAYRTKGIWNTLVDEAKKSITSRDLRQEHETYVDPKTGRKKYRLHTDIGDNQAAKVNKRKELIYITLNSKLDQATAATIDSLMKEYNMETLPAYKYYKAGTFTLEELKSKIYATEDKNGNLKPSSKQASMRVRYLAEEQVAQEKNYDLSYIFHRFIKATARAKHRANKESLFDVAVDAMMNRSLANVNDLGENVGSGQLVMHSNIGESVNETVRRFKGAPVEEKLWTYKTRLYTEQDKEYLRHLEKVAEHASTDRERKLIEEEQAKVGGVITGTSAANAVFRTTQLLGIGWNLKTAILNMSIGQLANYIEAERGLDFDRETYWMAFKIAMSSIGNILSFGVISSPYADKVKTLMEKYDFTKDATGEIQKALAQSEISKYTKDKWWHPFHLTQRAELFNQSVLVIAMLMTKKVSEVSAGYQGDATVWEAFNDDGSWNSEVYGEFNPTAFRTNVMSPINQKIKEVHGNYDPDAPLLSKTKILTQGLGQYKRWMVEAYQVRFESEKYDIKLGRARKGRWRTAYDAFVAKEGVYLDSPMKHADMIFFFLKQLGRKMLFRDTQYDKYMNSLDAANMKAFTTEMMLLGMIVAGIQIISSLGDDDEDQAWIQVFILNQLFKVMQEVTLFVSPKQLINNAENIMPALNTLNNLRKSIIDVVSIPVQGVTEDGYQLEEFKKDLWNLGKSIPVISAGRSTYNEGINLVSEYQ